MIHSPARALIALLAVAVAACGGTPTTSTSAPKPQAQAIRTTASTTLTRADISSLADAFNDHPFQGGQTPPFISKWVSPDSFMFLQLDKPRPEEATAVAYLGLGQRGLFCSESQPDRSASAGSSFPAFHQWKAGDFEKGLGGKAGSEGYWLTYLAADKLDVSGRSVNLGIDYRISAPPSPSCGTASRPAFAPAGAGKQSADSIARMFSIFTDQPLQGGQVAPRIFKQINSETLAFLQYDHNTAGEATELRYLGIWRKSRYCQSTQPSPDFTHFHMVVAPSYAQGHGGPPSTVGFWGTWIAAVQFQSQGRTVLPGVDREFSPTPPPSSC